MFYYRINTARRTTEPDGASKRSSATEYREYANLGDLGDYVVAQLAKRGVVRVSVDKINQAAFVRATRPND